MLKILSGNANSYMNFKINKPSKLRVGQIARLSTTNNNVVAVQSNGIAPLGLVVKKIRIKKKSGEISHAVKICISNILIETDNFDPKQSYPVNATLYLSEDNKYTTRRDNYTSPCIGLVTMPPSVNNPHLQLMIAP